jgi:maltodextrin utilization protein YvdJ
VIRIFGYIWLLIRIQVLLTAVKLFTCRFQDYDYRISTLKWYTIFLVCLFLVSTILFLVPLARIQEKIIFYLLNTFIIILLLIITVTKRNQLYKMRQ